MSLRPVATLAPTLHVGGEAPVAVMGVLNVSPESFHAGSIHAGRDALAGAARAMVAAGAALIDVGARSTAPYLDTAIDEGEEADRLGRAVAALVGEVAVPISADTARPGPARAALAAGARVLNDVSGLRDQEVGRLAAAQGAGLVLMARPDGRAEASTPLDTVRRLLAEGLERARTAGIPDERVVLDPGIGFFRSAGTPWHAWDVEVIAGLAVLEVLGRPLCVGVSRKSFLGAITGRRTPGERLAASLAATAAAVLGGAALVRTHDVPETVDAVRVAERLRRARESLRTWPDRSTIVP